MITNAITLEQGVTVTQLKGKIYLLAADGSRKLLVEGDVLPKGAVIVSPDGGSFMGGNQSFNVQPAGQPSESAEEGDAPQLAQNGAPGTPSDINALQQAILGGADPTKTFEASAAGGAPAAGGGGVGGVAGASGNGGFVTIDRVGDATISQAGFDTTNPVDTGVIANALPGTDNQLIDLVPPVITVSAPDNSNDTTPTLTGTTDAPAGSIVTLLVTDANGNQQTLTAIVNPNGTFTVDVVTPLAEGSYNVTASVTDPAGNTGSATDDGSVDTVAPELGIELNLITVGSDNVVNKAEADGKASVTLSGTVNGDAKVGDTVTLTLGDGSKLTSQVVALGNGQLGFSTSTTADKLVGGSSVRAEITVTDAAGNSTTATDTENYGVDTVPPEISSTSISYTENQTAGAVLGNIGAADDKAVTSIVFKATGTNTSADGYYQINANGDVVLTAEGAKAGVNDFEQAPNSGSYDVVVSDAAGNQIDSTITLNETNLDDNAPKFEGTTDGQYSFSYDENSAAGKELG
ncbi:retention module-containing protein, partial [Aeromonas jandaei]|uniref:retention module-containing protein n=1 Tax=Aeromonas jandaei TaxID=650 RepID=UPI00366C190F